MTTFGQSLIVVAVLASGIIYGTDVFSAIVLRPALAQVDDHTLVSTMGRVHEIADRRMRVPGVAGIVFAIAGTALLAGAHHTGATIAGVIAIVALAIWLPPPTGTPPGKQRHQRPPHGCSQKWRGSVGNTFAPATLGWRHQHTFGVADDSDSCVLRSSNFLMTHL